MEKYGQRIQKYRKKLRLAQHELAKKINVSQVAVSKWENNLNEPDIKTLIDLAHLFGVSLEELTGATPLSHPITTIQKKRQLLIDILTYTNNPVFFTQNNNIESLEEEQLDTLIDELAETIDYTFAKQKKKHNASKNDKSK